MKNQNFTLTGYETLDRIYSGTRTLVYRGTRLCDQQPVAIKVLHSEYPSFSELVQFRNQYTIAKNLQLRLSKTTVICHLLSAFSDN